MALVLYRIGRFSYRRPWQVIIAWLLVLAAALGVGLGMGGTMRESFAIPGTQSQEALDRLSAVFPQTAGASANVIVVAPEGDSIESAATVDAIEAATGEIGEIEGVVQALSPFSEYATDSVSVDSQAAIIRVQFEEETAEVTEAQLEALMVAGDRIAVDGNQVYYSGAVFEEIEYGLTVTELIGVMFAAFVLIITFGSVLAAGLPLLSALVAVGTTMGGILAVAGVTAVSSATPLLAVMIGIAVGIDYALFVLSRHRNQLATGMDAQESAATAVGTSGSAVVFAGVTVMIALLGLMIVGIPFLSVMGVAAAVAVLLAMLAAITFLPALFGLFGEKLRPKEGSRAHRRAAGVQAKPTMGRRWVRTVLRAPWAFIIGVVGVLGVLAIPALSLQLALPSAAGQQPGTVARDGYDVMTEHFGEGANGPLVVMLDITQAENETLLDDLQAVSDLVATVPGIKTVGGALPNPTVDSAIIQVIPLTGPDDPATEEVVAALRGLEDQVRADYNIDLSVTGYTAVAIDISDRLGQSLLPFAIVVVGLSFVLLMMVFRSVLVPLTAALSFLLSVFAAFGVVVAIFQWGWFADAMSVVPGPIISFMPILLMAIIFGLAMDYQVFLVSGMREAHVLGQKPREAIETGFAGGARVVTAAALIMFFVFIAFVPEGAGVIKAIALGLAAGIAFDAFLVRMTLVPALMAVMGKAAWWLPKWLDRIVPQLDIEGERLRHHRDDAGWANVSAERAAIGANELVAGDSRFVVGPVTFEVPHGAIVLVRGLRDDRTVLGATLAGRLAPARGRLHVLGHALPGDAAQVRKRAGVVSLDELPERGGSIRISDLLRERLQRVGANASEAVVESLIVDVERSLARVGVQHARVPSGATLASLELVPRALVTAQIALAEHPDVLIADLGALATTEIDDHTAERIIDGLSRMASHRVTLVLGLPIGTDIAALVEHVTHRARPVVRLELEPDAVGEFVRQAGPSDRDDELVWLRDSDGHGGARPATSAEGRARAAADADGDDWFVVDGDARTPSTNPRFDDLIRTTSTTE